MFQIVRQEMRAAYNPRSDFLFMGKNKAMIAFSATVEASNWPEVYDQIEAIYNNVRLGNAERAGLEIQYDKLKRSHVYQFYTDPSFGAQHYLHDNPLGTMEPFTLSFLDAHENMSPAAVNSSADTYLPQWEEFLLVLIGGGASPTSALSLKGFCSLPKNTPLSYCLDVLADTHN